MSYPPLHTAAARGPEPEDRANQSPRAQRQYSWVQTPVEMEGRRHLLQETIPPLPTIPDDLRQGRDTATQQAPGSAQYSYDQKPDPSTIGTHPSDYAPYIDDSYRAPDPQTQQYHGWTVPSSPGPLPNKIDLASSNQPSGVMIAPDENPLTPTTPNQPQDKARSINYPPQASPGIPRGYDNHYPGQAANPNQQVKGGTWKHGLCDCGDVGACCTGLWCPCILYGKTQYRLSQRSEKKDPTNMLGYETLNGSCAVYAVLCGCNWILAAIQHTRIRKTYEIPGSIGSDCVRALCCSCCTLSQDEKEMKHRENHVRQNSGPGTSGPQYATPAGMSYPAPPK